MSDERMDERQTGSDGAVSPSDVVSLSREDYGQMVRALAGLISTNSHLCSVVLNMQKGGDGWGLDRRLDELGAALDALHEARTAAESLVLRVEEAYQ